LADLKKALAIATKTGKVMFGVNSALTSAMTGKIRLIVAASNCPREVREDLKHSCKLSKIPFLVYPGTGLELGRVCGKPFAVSTLAIREPGDSDILEIAVESSV